MKLEYDTSDRGGVYLYDGLPTYNSALCMQEINTRLTEEEQKEYLKGAIKHLYGVDLEIIRVKGLTEIEPHKSQLDRGNEYNRRIKEKII